MSQALFEAVDRAVGTPIEREWATSDVRRVEVDGRAIYVKRYLPQPHLGLDWETIRRRTAREVALMTTMTAHAPCDGGLGTVTVEASDPDRGMIATREVPGRPIAEKLFGRPSDRTSREVLRMLFLAGRWLRWYQSLPLTDEDIRSHLPDDPPNLVEYCRIRIERIRELGYPWPDRKTEGRILGTLKRLWDEAPPKDRRMVWCHHDFGPQNIHWDGRTVTPIDFGTSRGGLPLADVTYLIHRLEMQRVYRPWLRLPLARWRGALLRGYGRPDATSTPMYRALMIGQLHCRLKTYVRREPRDLKQRWHNAWTRRCVRSQLLRLLERP